VQLELAEGTLARDQAMLNNAKLDLQRYQTLLAQDAIPKQQLDTQTALVAQFEGNIKQDTANINSAKLNLTYAKVVAPITGVVGLRQVDPGNIVHASDANGMIVITQLQPISVLFTIPEDNLPQVTQKLRAGAHLPVDAYNRDNSKKIASGTLVTLDNQIDSTTGTSKLKAVFKNTDNALFPQQFVNIRLLVDTLGNQQVVPNVAIQNGQQGTFVYAVDQDSRVHLKPVQVGITTQTSSQILGGLSDGDRVVVDGTDRLIEGARVRVRRAGELENPPGFDPGAGGGGGGGKKGGKGRKGGGNFKKGQGGGDSQ
jgi:multidrug efflux system membrane fusion protein